MPWADGEDASQGGSMKHANRFATVPTWGRREFLRAAGLSVAGLALPASLLGGCGDDGGSAGSEAAIPLTVDPNVPWWLQNGFEPVLDELSTGDLRVRGRIPRQLSGLYVRNGSNPQHSDSPHWFFGDGMLHGIRFSDGRAVWYGNKYVQTPLYEMGVRFNEPGLPPIGGNNQSNVSAVYHAGKLLTSGEIAFPYHIDPSDLSTIGVYDFDGALQTSFTAHPKIDPATGYLHFFGYWFFPPYLTYNVADASGQVIHAQPIPVSATTMIHSFAITERDAIFWELPVLFSLEAALNGAANPFSWQPDYGARLGVLPLGGDASEIRWVEIEPCYVFHEVNAYRAGDEIVIDVSRHDRMFDHNDLNDTMLTVRRWRIDTGGAALSFRDEVVVDEEFELPTHDRRITGRPHRYGWFVTTRENPDTVDLAGIARVDYRTGRVRRWDPGLNRHAGEAFFVPGGSGEGDGWLLSLVYDRAERATDLCILDAHHPDDGPVAEIRLPRRVPHGFHATWIPA
jgi:carotenoid cleavage dioxygenase-like enzyme